MTEPIDEAAGTAGAADSGPAEPAPEPVESVTDAAAAAGLGSLVEHRPLGLADTAAYSSVTVYQGGAVAAHHTKPRLDAFRWEDVVRFRSAAVEGSKQFLAVTHVDLANGRTLDLYGHGRSGDLFPLLGPPIAAVQVPRMAAILAEGGSIDVLAFTVDAAGLSRRAGLFGRRRLSLPWAEVGSIVADDGRLVVTAADGRVWFTGSLAKAANVHALMGLADGHTQTRLGSHIRKV